MGISTGSIAVDYIVGNGGFPRSKVSEIFGPPSSGKSTLCAMACAKAQAQGLYPVYIDVERGLDRKFAEDMGFDVGAALKGQKGLYVVPETFEETLKVMDVMITKGKADIVFVDSVASLVPEDSFKADLTEMNKMGLQARLFSSVLPKLTKIIDKPLHKTALVFVNQVRANIVTGWNPNASNQPTTKSGGGWALFHFSSLRLELSQLKKDAKVIEERNITDPSKIDKIPVASLHNAMAHKNKVSPPYRKIQFYIRYDPENDIWGIDNLQSTIDIAKAPKYGLIQTSGAYYTFEAAGEKMNARGEEAMYNWFLTHPEALQALRGQLGV